MSKQITLFDIIADDKKKRTCDCWLDVGKCYCIIPKSLSLTDKKK